jgi:hypothetical protein
VLLGGPAESVCFVSLSAASHPEAPGALVEAFSKLLDHTVEFVRIVSGDSLGDQIFDAVLKASPAHGEYFMKNTAIADRGTSSDTCRALANDMALKEPGLRSCVS